jgi:signal peptidase I
MSQSGSGTIWENFKQIGLAVILALIIKTSIVEAYKIPTASMEDTLLVGDFLLANKFVYGARVPLVNWRLPAVSDPEPGDVVIFIFPGDDNGTKYIKRCVGTPGDTIEVRDWPNTAIPRVLGRLTSGRGDPAGRTAAIISVPMWSLRIPIS